MTEKNTVVAVLIAGSVYVTALFFLSAQESQEFWFWSSAMAWGFLAIFLIYHLRTYSPPIPREDKWTPEDQKVLQAYVQKSSDILVTKWSPAIALVIYESIIIMLLSTTDRSNFSRVHAVLDDAINTKNELTDSQPPANVESQSSNGEIHDYDSKQANTSGDG